MDTKFINNNNNNKKNEEKKKVSSPYRRVNAITAI
jgi:hypothetical protein